MEILGDNKTSFTLTKATKSQNCTKYINMMHHYIQGLVEKEKLRIEEISNLLVLVDNLTKAFTVGFFNEYQDK